MEHKHKTSEKKSELLQNDQEIADELNIFFKNTVSNLNDIIENLCIINQVLDDILDPVKNCINKGGGPISTNFIQAYYLAKIELTFKICFYSMLQNGMI